MDAEESFLSRAAALARWNHICPKDSHKIKTYGTVVIPGSSIEMNTKSQARHAGKDGAMKDIHGIYYLSNHTRD